MRFLGVLSLFILAASLTAEPLTPVEVRFATSDQPWAPFRTVTKEGTEEGLVPDLLHLVLEQRLGFRVTIHPLPWVRAQEMVAQGELDCTITLATPARMSWAVASKARLYSIYFKLFTRAHHPMMTEIRRIQDLAEIKRLGLTVVSNAGNNWIKENVERIGIPVHYVASDEAIIRSLEAGRADVTIDSPLSLTPRIANLGLGDRIVETEARFDEVWFQLLWGRRSPLFPLWPEIDQTLTDVVGSREYQELVKRYLTP